MTVESPCVRICCLDDNDICLGCYRSLKEIVEWGSAPDEARRAILKTSEARRDEALAKRRSGRGQNPS